jgi:transposase
MARTATQIILGIDVAKSELVIAEWETGKLTTLPNDAAVIKNWLESLPGTVKMAVEPTSHYHLVIVNAAHALGHEVYLVNPRQLSHYRAAVDVRNKTDPEDAFLLARYLAHESSHLRLYKPQSLAAQELWALLKRRAVVVQARKQLEQSFREVSLSTRGVMTQFNALLKRIDQRMLTLIEALDWSDDYRRCLSIPGIGPLNAAALVSAFHRGAFSGADAFVAYIGLDVTQRDSGQMKGKRKLSKRGPAELRRLLWCAAKPARSYRPFAEYHQRQLDKGLAKTAANCILGRKLARLAFTLMTRREMFNQEAKTC